MVGQLPQVSISFLLLAFVLAFSLSSSWLFLLLIPSAACFGLRRLAIRRLQRLKLMETLRGRWGAREVQKERDFQRIAAFFRSNQQPGVIDDRTWQDLTMDTVFSRLDRTLTWPGVQVLYSLLRTPESDELDRLEQRKQVISAFERQDAVRERLQVILSGLQGRGGSELWELLWNPPALTPPHPLFLYDIVFVLALLAAPLIISSSWYTIYMLLISYINSRLHARAYQDIRRYVHSVRAVGQLVVASAKLARVEAGFLKRFSACCGEAVRKVWFLPLLARSVGAESKQRRLARSIRVYPNIFFLSEVRGFYRSLRLTQRNREALQKLFLTVGEVDALQSVASYRTSLDYFCEPEFTGEQGFELEDAYHPLLAKPVPNSIDLSVRGILISGGSMSGKSTFLRTVGLNVLLAQSIVTCHARVYKACPLRLITFMDRVESVLEGRGYFLDEALRVRAAIEAIGQAPTTLVIFDELFRGASSAERITAASRVLGYLSKRDAFVLVATHDLELTKLLGDVYANFHFSQGGGESGFQFDYKLKEGPAVVGNAMALLRHLGYPEDITM